MSSTLQSKGWASIIAGVGAFVGAAVLFHMASDKLSTTSKFLKEIDDLGPPKKEMNGFLSFGYYKDIFAIIQRNVNAKFEAKNKQKTKLRRTLLKQNKISEYKEVLKNMNSKEDATFGKFLSEVMDHLNLTECEFLQMHQVYLRNPQTQQILMEAMTPTPKGPPKITRQKCKEIFIKEEEKMRTNLKNLMINVKVNQADLMEGISEMIIDQTMLMDQLLNENDVEEEDYHQAIAFYDISQEKDIQGVNMAIIQKLRFGRGGFEGLM